MAKKKSTKTPIQATYDPMRADYEQRVRAAFEVLERDGYRFCSAPACNCGSFHRQWKPSPPRGSSEFTCEFCGEGYPFHHKKCSYVAELRRIDTRIAELSKCRCGVLFDPSRGPCGSCGATEPVFAERLRRR